MREQLLAAEKVTGIRWQGGVLHLLDQRLLPSQEHWLACDTVAQVATAIRDMAVRGDGASASDAVPNLACAAGCLRRAACAGKGRSIPERSGRRVAIIAGF